MLDRKRLRAEILRHGKKQKDMARLLGMTDKTFSVRLREGWFRTDEVERMMAVLGMTDPRPIFFASAEQHTGVSEPSLCGKEGTWADCPLLAELAKYLAQREERTHDLS